MSIETVECSLVVPNSTIISGSSESCNLITDRRSLETLHSIICRISCTSTGKFVKYQLIVGDFPCKSSKNERKYGTVKI